VGTIRTAIALYDGVTSPLQSMHKAMGVVLSTFESMQQASGRAVDTAAIREAREEWAKAGTAFDAIEENIRNANNEQQKFNNSIRGGNNSANGLLSTIKKIAVAAGGIVGINKVQNISDKLASTKARLNLLVDDGGSVDVLEQKIMASAQRSRSVYFDTASAVAKLGLNAGNAFNGDMNQVIAFMEQVNKQFVIGGATAQEQSNAMIQLTQAMAAGALRGEELNSILDGAPGIARAIEKYMGIAEGSIKTVAQEGKVTAEVVKNAMFAMADETNAKFDSMPKTWAQIWAGMKNKALSMFAPILTKINQIANSTKFQQVTTALINGLAGVANVASSVLDILIAIASVFVDNWGIIQPLVLGIAAAMLLYNGYLIANNAITAISNAQKGLAAVQAYKAAVANTTLAATEKAEAMAKASATAAQYGFNAALLACPLTWILLIIIAVIAAIYMIVAAINKLTGSTISATGIICGVVAVAGAFVLNCAIGILNAIIQAIWTIFVAPFLGIVEWILNVCNGGFNSFGDAVANLIGQIIGWFLNLGKVVTTIIDAIFGTDWTSGLESLQSAVTSWGKNENAITLDKNAPTIDYRATYSGAWDAGYDFGQGIDDKIGGMFDASGLDSMGAFDLSNTLDGIYGNTGDTAANTAATADALDIAEEDLAYLRDIAEREAINRFTTAEIKVEQHNENHISKDADLDGIMDAWANDFAEKLEVSEEGVHE
jgi:tape measure domain-containing protein